MPYGMLWGDVGMVCVFVSSLLSVMAIISDPKDSMRPGVRTWVFLGFSLIFMCVALVCVNTWTRLCG